MVVVTGGYSFLKYKHKALSQANAYIIYKNAKL
nr:MAG TPA: hypothetical protein [Caudoviricetes sp.]